MAYGPFLAAQTPDITYPTDDSRIERLEKRFDGMEKQHRAEFKFPDGEIARLKGQFDRRDSTTQPAKDTGTNDLLKAIDTASPRGVSDIDKTRQQVLQEAGTRSSFLPRTPISFNPDFAVVADYQASDSSDHRTMKNGLYFCILMALPVFAAVDSVTQDGFSSSPSAAMGYFLQFTSQDCPFHFSSSPARG